MKRERKCRKIKWENRKKRGRTKGVQRAFEVKRQIKIKKKQAHLLSLWKTRAHEKGVLKEARKRGSRGCILEIITSAALLEWEMSISRQRNDNISY
jgi:hypothetical protein